MKGMIITILGSGSSGNAFVIQHEGSTIMIDAGFTLKDMTSKLKNANIAMTSIQALFITHGHGDHTLGIMDLNRNAAIPVYMTEKLFLSSTGADNSTSTAWLELDESQAVLFNEWDNIHIGSFTVTPIPVSHDSVSPVGFIIRAGEEKLALVTDAGELSQSSKDAMKESNIIMLESNHDSKMLWSSTRTYPLKRRISSASGHLSNEKSATILSEIISPCTRDVVLLHLSEECNTPELAEAAVRAKNPGLSDGMINLHIAKQHEPLSFSIETKTEQASNL